MWSGPSSSMTYSGTPRPCSAASSWSEVFQSRPAPSADGRLDERVEEPVHDLGGHLDAAAEVHGADHGLDGVGEDRRLVAAAGGLLAAAELDVLAEPDAAADLGQRAGVDDGRPQLGQPALGEVGVGAVERLGDDDAEHGVTEELQALVGRQPAVLVGVRAVGQRALEQLGVQHGVPERCSQLRVVGQRTGPVRGPDDGRRARRTGRTCRTPVREVLGTAGGVRAGHQGRRGGLPGRATVARVAARHLPLRDSHGVLSTRSARSAWSSGGLGRLRPRSAERRPPRVDRRVVCVVGVVGQPRSALGAQPGQSSMHSGWNGSASTTASRSSGLEVDQVVPAAC